jgi:protein TonB
MFSGYVRESTWGQAVEQWRYRPFVLNGQPIEVETEITINFTLGGS